MYVKITVIVAVSILCSLQAQAQKEGFRVLLGGYRGFHTFKNFASTGGANANFYDHNMSAGNLEVQFGIYSETVTFEMESDVLLYTPVFLATVFSDNNTGEKTFFQFKDPWGDINYLGFNLTAGGEHFQGGFNFNLDGYGSSSGQSGIGLVIATGASFRTPIGDMGSLRLYPTVDINYLWSGLQNDGPDKARRKGIELSPSIRGFLAEYLYFDIIYKNKRFRATDSQPRAVGSSWVLGLGLVL